MIKEHTYAVLVRDFPELGLSAGDVGVVVHVHVQSNENRPVGYMLEFFNFDGLSRDEISVPADAVRPATAKDRMAARVVAAE